MYHSTRDSLQATPTTKTSDAMSSETQLPEGNHNAPENPSTTEKEPYTPDFEEQVNYKESAKQIKSSSSSDTSNGQTYSNLNREMLEFISPSGPNKHTPQFRSK
jgi:hypothetical protein